MVVWLLFIGLFCLLLGISGAVTEVLCDIFPSLGELICGREEFEDE